MVRIIFVIAVLVLVFNGQAHARKYSTNKPSASKVNASTIEIIQGDTNKKYDNFGFLVEESHSAKLATEKLKKTAYQKGAQAIIKFELKAVEGAGINIWWGCAISV